MKKFDFNKICITSFIFSLLLNFPTFFNWYTSAENVKLLDSSTHLIYYWAISDFSSSIYGKVITFIVFFIRDFFFLMIKINLNIMSVILIRKHLTKVSVSNMIGDVISKKPYITKTDRALTKMVIIGTLLSILENIFFTIANGYYLFKIDELSGLFTIVSYLSIALKHGSNFILFFLFNHSFRSQLKKKFKTKYLC